MPREGEVRIDCERVRTLLLEECRLTVAGAEARMNVPHSVLHRMMGGSRRSPKASTNVTIANAQQVIRLTRSILSRSEEQLPLERILYEEAERHEEPKATLPKVASDQPVVLPYPSLEKLFKGREGFLRELRASVLGGHGNTTAIVSSALLGMGGIGKTRAAVEYAWAYRQEYTALLFVQADSPENLHTNLAALSEPLRLPEYAAVEQSFRFHAVLCWLRANPGWLLILDNVDSDNACNAVSSMLGSLTGGHVILTSRLSGGLGRGIATKALDLLARDDAVEFLFDATSDSRRAQPDDRREALLLAHTVGRLALALELAAGTIEYRGCSFKEYRHLWDEARDLVKGWNRREITGYHHAVAQTWAVSVGQVSSAARALLERLAFLAPAPIPGSLFKMPGPDVDVRSSREAALELCRVSLVNHEVEKDQFLVHRLIQDATRRSLDTVQRQLRLIEALAWVNAALDQGPEDARGWPRAEPLVPHVEFITSAVIAIFEARLGPEHPSVATALNNLAESLSDSGRVEEAEQLYRRAVRLVEERLGADHESLGTYLSNLAQLLSDSGRVEEAEQLHRRAVRLVEERLGADHQSLGTYLSNLAQLLCATDRRNEAEALMRRALQIGERTLGADHPQVLAKLDNLANLLRDMGRRAEAEELMQRALSIEQAAHGPDYPELAIRLARLALFLLPTNRLAEAEEMMRRSVIILLKNRKGSSGRQARQRDPVTEHYADFLSRAGHDEESIERAIAAAYRETD